MTFISLTFSLLLLKITLLIIRVWVTNGAQTANGVFQTSNNSTYISLPKTNARRIIPVKMFYRVFLSRGDASPIPFIKSFHAEGLFQRAGARSQSACTSARLARAHARTPASYPSDGNSALHDPSPATQREDSQPLFQIYLLSDPHRCSLVAKRI